MNNRRVYFLHAYLDWIKSLEKIKLLLPYERDKYFYQMFGITTERKEDLIIFLKSKGIATGCHYPPLTMQPLFKPYASPCPVAKKEYFKTITLLLHAALTNEALEYIVTELSKFT